MGKIFLKKEILRSSDKETSLLTDIIKKLDRYAAKVWDVLNIPSKILIDIGTDLMPQKKEGEKPLQNEEDNKEPPHAVLTWGKSNYSPKNYFDTVNDYTPADETNFSSTKDKYVLKDKTNCYMVKEATAEEIPDKEMRDRINHIRRTGCLYSDSITVTYGSNDIYLPNFINKIAPANTLFTKYVIEVKK